MHPPDLRLLAARFALNLVHTDEAIDTAHAVLGDGIYTRSLGELATFPQPRGADADALLAGALAELGIPVPARADAVGVVLAGHFRPIGEGTVTPAVGIGRLAAERYELFSLVDRYGELDRLTQELLYRGYAYDEYGWDAESLAPPAELDAATVRLARQWGREYGRGRVRPEWLTSTVVCLAEVVRGGGFDRLPILADALEDAGCDDTDMLEHCRHADRHSGSCWVADLLLGEDDLDRGSEEARRAESA